MSYRTLKQLGSGATSKVYLCEKEGKKYALKVVKDEKVAMDEEPSTHIHCLARELRILQTLPHPNIITVHEVVKIPQFTCLYLEYMKDGDLWHRRLTTTLLRHVTREVAAGLQWLHGHNIVHRDVKPENILLDGDKVKLCDFGLSIDMGSHEILKERMAGTVDFMAPELFKGEVRRASDAWSLGAVLYEMSTGNVPFEEALEWHTSNRIMEADYSWPKHHQDMLLQDLVDNLLVLKPARRLTMEQVLQHPWCHRQPTPPPRRVLRSGAQRNVVQRNVDANRDDARKEIR